MNIYERLSNIQIELKAPKNQYNSYGKYNYRSAEDILEAVKPLCAKYNTTLIISDKINEVGGRVYVEAEACLYDFEGNIVCATASAREAQDKKGMDDSQITGSTSSYARKYAMNGLFNIDDTKDADDWNTHNKEQNKPHKPTTKPQYSNEEEMFQIGVEKTKKAILSKLDKDEYKQYKVRVLQEMCKLYKVESFNDIKVNDKTELDALTNHVASKIEIVKLEQKGDI